LLGFTLIELLVVIAIIAILAGFYFRPGARQGEGKVVKAHTELYGVVCLAEPGTCPGISICGEPSIGTAPMPRLLRFDFQKSWTGN